MLAHHLAEITKEFLPISTTPALDAELLAAHVLGQDRTYILSHPEISLSVDTLQTLHDLVNKRKQAYPVAYLTNKREFWGHEFYVDESVLIPRPETETLVATALSVINQLPPTYVIDIGTGSGCIPISLAKTIPQHTYLATDISPEAIRVAYLNAIKHRVLPYITFYTGDLLNAIFSEAAKLQRDNLVILANLPYVDMDENPRGENTPYRRQLHEGLKYEPRQALHGGQAGLELYQKLLQQIATLQLKNSILIFEIGYDQAPSLIQQTMNLFPQADITTHPDLAGIDRVLKVRI